MHETDEQWAMRRSQELANEEGRPYIVTVAATGQPAIMAHYPGCEKRDDFLCTVHPAARADAGEVKP